MAGEYPPNWPEIAKLVKDEADWHCERCSHPHDPANGYCMTVHHFDMDKSNVARWNLMPLCQRCHLMVQGRVSVSQGLLFSEFPSNWSMPYVAGAVMANRTPPPIGFDLAQWIDLYEKEIGIWPKWAVTPEPPHPLHGAPHQSGVCDDCGKKCEVWVTDPGAKSRYGHKCPECILVPDDDDYCWGVRKLSAEEISEARTWPTGV